MHARISTRRRWPLILIALAIVLAGGWSALWYYAAGRAETVIAGWREREAKVGTHPHLRLADRWRISASASRCAAPIRGLS